MGARDGPAPLRQDQAKSVDRLAIISAGRLIAEGTPSSFKAADRGQLRLQVMLLPDAATPALPPWVRQPVRVGHNLVTVIDEADAARGIGWAADLVGRRVAEEYALGACTSASPVTSRQASAKMTELTAALSATRLRGGVGYWLDSYRAPTRWHLASLRMWLMLLTVVQVMAGAGFVLGIALFFDRIPASAALFVCTGVPVINLMIVGLILGPQLAGWPASPRS